MFVPLVGPLAPGQRVRATTSSAELIGTNGPFGPAQRERANGRLFTAGASRCDSRRRSFGTS